MEHQAKLVQRQGRRRAPPPLRSAQARALRPRPRDQRAARRTRRRDHPPPAPRRCSSATTRRSGATRTRRRSTTARRRRRSPSSSSAHCGRGRGGAARRPPLPPVWVASGAAAARRSRPLGRLSPRAPPLGPSAARRRERRAALRRRRPRGAALAAVWVLPAVRRRRSAVGLAYQPLVFALTLFDLVNFSAVLRSVLRAVSNKARDLLVTLAFMLIITYCFGALGLVLLREEFAAEGSPCHDVLSCWVTVMSEGMRRGDIGESLERIGAAATLVRDGDGVLARLLGDRRHAVAQPFFGIILDSFGELRAAESARVADSSSVCFICGPRTLPLRARGRLVLPPRAPRAQPLVLPLPPRPPPVHAAHRVQRHRVARRGDAARGARPRQGVDPPASPNRALALRHEEAHARREREEEEARQARVDEEQRRVADQLSRTSVARSGGSRRRSTASGRRSTRRRWRSPTCGGSSRRSRRRRRRRPRRRRRRRLEWSSSRRACSPSGRKSGRAPSSRRRSRASV